MNCNLILEFGGASLVWDGGFFYLHGGFLVDFVGLDDLGAFLIMLAIPSH